MNMEKETEREHIGVVGQEGEGLLGTVFSARRGL